MIVINHTKPIYQVINRKPGNATDEEKIQTSDGTWWHTVQYLPERGTGDRQGVLYADIVIERGN